MNIFKSRTKDRLYSIERQIGDSDSCWHGCITRRLQYLEHAIGSGMSIKSVLVDPKLPTPKEQIQELNNKIDAICAHLGVIIEKQPTELVCKKNETK